MSLWLLTLDASCRGWDCSCAHVVRAADEASARAFAGAEAGDEGADVWLGPMATCEPLAQEGDAGVILTDFQAG